MATAEHSRQPTKSRLGPALSARLSAKDDGRPYHRAQMVLLKRLGLIGQDELITPSAMDGRTLRPGPPTEWGALSKPMNHISVQLVDILPVQDRSQLVVTAWLRNPSGVPLK
ncbi:hypothetical protein ZWY2020_027155 [Hordeum vulgare]|nr:hypothetical protein ZWY2020_027155 [Hordeum vulgare]